MKKSTKNKMKRYCSCCCHSKYVIIAGERKLRCEHLAAFGQRPYLPTNCQDAEECLAYDAEDWHKNLTDRRDYLAKMRRCGVPLFEERFGVLKRETLID